MANTNMKRILVLLALSRACSSFTTTTGTVSSPLRALRPITAKVSTLRGVLSLPLLLEQQQIQQGLTSRKWQIAAHSTDRMEERSGSATSSRKKAWPRRIWSKITSSRKDQQGASRPLRMQTMDAETEALLESVTSYYQGDFSNKNDTIGLAFRDDFILRNFEDFSPGSFLPSNHDVEMTTPLLDEEFYNVKIEQAAVPDVTAAAVTTTKTSGNTSSSKAAFVSRWLGVLFENILTGIIERKAQESPENLRIRAFPQGNPMATLLRGQFCIDAELDVGRLVFPAIRMSSGRLEVKRLTLQLLGFLGQNSGETKKTPTRFPKQFDLHAHDWTFSRHDLLFSPCMRNGLRLLLVRILRDRGVQESSIQVDSLDVLPSGKISVKGKAKTLFDSPLNFEVRSGIDSSTRGHVLTFPGLEVSLTGDLGLFVPVVPTIDIDVGHNARFREIHIDGKRKQLRLSASVTITPKSTIHLNDYKQSKAAFSARYSTDVGKWLTRIGNFIR